MVRLKGKNSQEKRMKKINYEEQECPLCGEYLNFNKDVVMKNKINGDFIMFLLAKNVTKHLL